MTGRTRVGVVVVVPAFAPCQGGYQSVVSRIVACLETSRAPQVRRRVYQPRKVPADDRSKENRPQHHRQAADRKQGDRRDDGRYPVVFIKSDLERVLHQVGRIPAHGRRRIVLCGAAEYPAHVRPVSAVERAVRVVVGFGERVMQPVCRDPCHRARLDGERSDNAQKSLEPTRSFETAMRQKAVITDADADAAGQPPHNERGRQILPAEGKQGTYCQCMKNGDTDHRRPI